MSTQPLVLVADDEPRITKLVSIALSEEGFRVVTASGGEEALLKAEEVRPDIVLLDIVMPDLDGIEVMRQLRERRPVPVILLTAKGSTSDKAKGLDLGADDYIAKPFHPDELAARVRAVIRRSSGAAPGAGVIAFDDVEIDLERRMVTRNGELVQLSRTEWLLLQHLAANAGKVVLHTELLTKVWGPEYRDDLQYLRVWVSRVRRKLGAKPGEAGRIRTFQGIGYLLDIEAAPKVVSEELSEEEQVDLGGRSARGARAGGRRDVGRRAVRSRTTHPRRRLSFTASTSGRRAKSRRFAVTYRRDGGEPAGARFRGLRPGYRLMVPVDDRPAIRPLQLAARSAVNGSTLYAVPDYDAATALIVVDLQNDFADPAGGLSVTGGDEIVPFVNAEIAAAEAGGALIAYTQDWHPAHTPHFAQDGGIWPVHCVQDTWGAKLHPDLVVDGPIVRKGANGEDGYSGFTMRDPVTGETVPTALEGLLRERDIRHAVDRRPRDGLLRPRHRPRRG